MLNLNDLFNNPRNLYFEKMLIRGDAFLYNYIDN
jgi:hypothetical protein